MSELFRKKSMERVTSPEQLNDYIRVSDPGVWMLLAAIIILLAGVCVWGIFGHLDTKTETAGVCENGTLVCYIKKEDMDGVQAGTLISVEGNECTVKEVSADPVRLDGESNAYLLYTSGLTAEDWVYAVTADCPLADGTYAVSVITERVAPLSFVLN